MHENNPERWQEIEHQVELLFTASDIAIHALYNKIYEAVTDTSDTPQT